MDDRRLSAAVMARQPLAAGLFDTLERNTHDGVGITRASYGEGEQFAHDLMRRTARELGLEVSTDPAGNSYLVLPGADRSVPRTIVGSHLDSVAQGGNFDGAAGVVAGLVAVAALIHGSALLVRETRSAVLIISERAEGIRKRLATLDHVD